MEGGRTYPSPAHIDKDNINSTIEISSTGKKRKRNSERKSFIVRR